MKSIFTGFAALAIVVGTVSIPASSNAATRDFTFELYGPTAETLQQSTSAPGCMRNPPPSQCKLAPVPTRVDTP